MNTNLIFGDCQEHLPKLESELVEDNEKIGNNPFTEDFLNKMQKRINLDHIKKELSDKLGNRTII